MFNLQVRHALLIDYWYPPLVKVLDDPPWGWQSVLLPIRCTRLLLLHKTACTTDRAAQQHDQCCLFLELVLSMKHCFLNYNLAAQLLALIFTYQWLGAMFDQLLQRHRLHSILLAFSGKETMLHGYRLAF